MGALGESPGQIRGDFVPAYRASSISETRAVRC